MSYRISRPGLAGARCPPVCRGALGFPGTFIYLGATAFVTFALIVWSNVLQRKLPDRIAEELSQQK